MENTPPGLPYFYWFLFISLVWLRFASLPAGELAIGDTVQGATTLG